MHSLRRVRVTSVNQAGQDTRREQLFRPRVQKSCCSHEVLDALPSEVQIHLGKFGDAFDVIDAVDKTTDLCTRANLGVQKKQKEERRHPLRRVPDREKLTLYSVTSHDLVFICSRLVTATGTCHVRISGGFA